MHNKSLRRDRPRALIAGSAVVGARSVDHPVVEGQHPIQVIEDVLNQKVHVPT